MRVLILRPEPGNAATAARVKAMGLDPVSAPLFDIVPRAWDPPDPARFDAVVMTSANAARHGGPALMRYTHLPLYAVGGATAKAARAAGFARVIAGTGHARDLMRTLAPLPESEGLGVGIARSATGAEVPLRGNPTPGPSLAGSGISALVSATSPSGTSIRILHLCGADHVALDLPNAVSVPVYAARPTDIGVLPAAEVALVHSPRAGARLAECDTGRMLSLVAISAAAAAACGTDWRDVRVAATPREASMLACLAQLCEARSR